MLLPCRDLGLRQGLARIWGKPSSVLPQPHGQWGSLVCESWGGPRGPRGFVCQPRGGSLGQEPGGDLRSARRRGARSGLLLKCDSATESHFLILHLQLIMMQPASGFSLFLLFFQGRVWVWLPRVGAGARLSGLGVGAPLRCKACGGRAFLTFAVGGRERPCLLSSSLSPLCPPARRAACASPGIRPELPSCVLPGVSAGMGAGRAPRVPGSGSGSLD